jgi:hypothetical protein
MAGAAGSNNGRTDCRLSLRLPQGALPNDFVGERHVVIVKRESTGSPYCEWCHFEERPGPAPPGSVDDACRVYLTEDDMAL